MSRKLAVFLVAVTVLGALVVLALRLLEQAPDDRASSGSVGGPVAAPAELPEVEASGTPRELQPPIPLDDPAATVGADTSRTGSAPGNSLTFTGLVVDDLDRPLAGAQVLFLPDARTLAAWGWKREGQTFLAGRTPADFAATASDEDGRFTLEARCVRARPGESRVAGLPATPCIIVLASGFMPYGHEVRDLRAQRDELGTLRMERGGSVTGRVVDERGAGLAGARVSFEVTNGWPRGTLPPDDVEPVLFSVATADDGRFELDDLPVAQLESEVTATDRRPRHWEAFILEVGQLHELPDLVLPLGGTLTGLVLDPDGRPIPGAEVVALSIPLAERASEKQMEARRRRPASGRRRELRTSTDDNGRFVLQGLAWDSASLRARARGFAAELVHDVVDGADVVLQLGEVAVLEVRVVDRASRAPLEASIVARASFFSPGEDRPPLDVQVSPDAPGHYRVLDAGAAGTDLIVTAAGQARVELKAPGVDPGLRGEVTIEMDPGWSLRGRVVDEAGAAIAEAAVKLVREDEGANLAATLRQLGYIGRDGNIMSSTTVRRPARPALACDEEGRFAFDELPTGTYFVEAEAGGHVSTTSAAIEVLATQPVPDCLLVLGRAGDVRGLLLDADGRPLPRFDVELQPATAGESHWTQCDTAGRFFFRDVAPGAWTVLTRNHGEAPVEVVAGETAEVVLRLAAVAVLDVVVLAHGLPVEGLEVAGSMPGMPLLTSRTGERGDCRFTLPAGRLRVTVDTRGGGIVSRDAELLAGDSRRLVIELPEGSLDVFVQELSTGKPAEGVGVAAVLLAEDGTRARLKPWEDPLGRATPRTDVDGRLRLEHLEAGTWEVHAGGSGWLRAEPVQATLATGVVAVTLGVRRSPTIRGRVQFPDGQPAPANTQVGFVRLHPPDPPSESGVVVRTGRQGEFSCDALEDAGTWVVVVPRGWGFESLQPEDVLAQATVQVAEGQTAEVVLTLPELP